MDKKLIDLVAQMFKLNCVYTDENFLHNQFFFQDEILAEDTALKMCSSYFWGRQKGLYGVVREVEAHKPIVDLFFMHECFPSDVYDDAICRVNLDYIKGGDMHVPLEDSLSEEEFIRSFGTKEYVPLIDERAELNASWIRVKPVYSFDNKSNSLDMALENSMRQIGGFLQMYRPLRRVFVDVDFSVHEPTLFSSFLVGAEFSFEENILGCEEMIVRAKEVYEKFRV